MDTLEPTPCTPIHRPAQQHYCIAVGVKDETGLLSNFGLPQYAAAAGTVPQSAGLGGAGGLGGARPGGVRAPVPRFFG